MQFFYHKDSGLESITLDSKDAHYLFHVRRFKQGETLLTTNLNDMQLYSYQHEKKNTFKLISLHSKVAQPKAYTHILLAMIDLKDIYDILPTLNALNVASLQLFYADFSQKNRKIDMQKAQRILQYSCMQCGRMKPLEIAIHNNLESVCKAFPNAIAIDFLESVETFDSNLESGRTAEVRVQNVEKLESKNNKAITQTNKALTSCHVERSKTSNIESTRSLNSSNYHFDLKHNQNKISNFNIESKRDFLPMAQNDKDLDSNKYNQNHAQQTFENLTQQKRQNIAKDGIIIGCEGGFSHNERKFLHTTQRVYALQAPFILTAHLVSTYIASLCV
ncbi:RsmE family RNA methyltransferase [Helicobacter bilis]|uniref:RsmE family RNA methyltransferase n=1 Tax=Helicobacter bilis TaxID=37372 RepID=UPI0026EB9189|nr:RsmE family RNA methyltransferase [Helicobacter bilis]MCI7410205.1 RsmE family RNA methyltransferase [Helicobacter bilis]MDD7297646.1 RsmE family RNA methyltransferase [Helicobacter bilis]MDY4400787.1 RsmE family RNA methyltransferase [Helicobacter bilis]